MTTEEVFQSISAKRQKLRLAGVRESFLSGVEHGVAAWMLYALFECLFSIFLPYLIEPKHSYMPVHWGFMVILFFCYFGAGLILGGLFGVLLHCFTRNPDIPQMTGHSPWLRAAASCSVVIALAIVTIIQVPIQRSYTWLMLLLCALLVMAVILNVRLNPRRILFRSLSTPWAIFAALLGFAWINSRLLPEHSIAAKGIVFICYSATVLSISALGLRALEKCKPRDSRELRPRGQVHFRYLIVLVVMAVYGLAIYLDRWPLEKNHTAAIPGREMSCPNIILITMDAVRADHTSVYGYQKDTTPVLRALAKTATTYAMAIAPGNMTLTAHASIFTGLYARRHGAAPGIPDHPAGRPMDTGVQTLAELLAAGGYSTKGVVANDGYLRNVFGFDRGFKYYDQRPRRRMFAGGAQQYYMNGFVRNLTLLMPIMQDRDVEYRRAGEINEEVFRLIDESRAEGKPFFLFVNYMDAHYPYVPPPPYDRLFDDKNAAKINSPQFYRLKNEVMSRSRNITESERNYLESRYDGGIAYIDHCIGELIRRLKDRGMYDKTILIVTSDHGETFGERNMLEHACSVYQNEISVPLIVRLPAAKDGAIVKGVVGLHDLMPTILEFANAKEMIPKDIDGESLPGKDAQVSRSVISESYPMGWKQKYPWINQMERAICDGSYKLIAGALGSIQLYDLTKDPNETTNTSNADRPVADRLSARLNKWLADTAPKGKARFDLDKGTAERLKTLGYIK